MIRLLCFLVLATLSLVAPAYAGTAVNGTKLLALCESEKADDQSLCTGYIMSIGDVLSDQTIYRGRACLPPTTSIDQLHQLVVLFLKSNPQHLEKVSGANLAALAMMHAYPCKEGS